MTDIRLPEALQAAIDSELGGGFKGPAAELSAAYRARQPSQRAIADQPSVAAYLATRLPATYAAVMTALTEAALGLPGFAPTSMLDAGAGPGTASWAAVTAFPMLATLTLVDHNRLLLETGARLRLDAAAPLTSAETILGDIAAPSTGEAGFDLVVASYALTELGEGALVAAALALWRRCSGAFVIVEPGRPRDYARLMAIRAALIEAGAVIAAPCPHEHACPLPAGDWCHFSVRLPRRRTHRQAKGAVLGYEDEKFSYLVAARPAIARRAVTARVIGPPSVSKFEVTMPLCTPEGLEQRVASKRQGAAFKLARKLDWGDAIG